MSYLEWHQNQARKLLSAFRHVCAFLARILEVPLLRWHIRATQTFRENIIHFVKTWYTRRMQRIHKARCTRYIRNMMHTIREGCTRYISGECTHWYRQYEPSTLLPSGGAFSGYEQMLHNTCRGTEVSFVHYASFLCIMFWRNVSCFGKMFALP